MNLRGLLAALGLGVLAPAVACSSGNSTTSAATGPVVRFKLAGDTAPDYLEVPFPSDAYLTPGGSVLDPIPGLKKQVPASTSYLTHGLGALNGFSRIGLAIFAVDDPAATPANADTPTPASIDPATLPLREEECTTDTSSVYLIDLAPSGDGQGATAARFPCRAFFHDDGPRQSTSPAIAVGPARGVLLEEGHAYAAVVTSRVKDLKGRPLVATSDMRAVAAGNATGATGAVYNQAFRLANAALKSALATDGATIVGLAPYTTMNKSRELYAMRDALEAAAAPALTWDAASMAPMGAVKFAKPAGGALPKGFTASLDDLLGVATAKGPDGSDDPDVGQPVRAHDKIAAMGTGVFASTSYLQVKADGYSDPDHATFAYDATGKPIPSPQQPTAKIWATFLVPTLPMPAAGYPTVIVQHGLNGSREYLLALANVMASKGWMTVGIDSVTFGARASEPSYQVDQSSFWAGSPGAKYAGPDGMGDPVKGSTNGSFDLFGGLQNLVAVRDQFRQAGFDTAQLVKVLRSSPDLSPLDTGRGAPKIDPERIAYLGDSLGAMQGTIAAAIEPNVKAWILNVNGGGLIDELVAHSPAIGILVASAAAFNFGVQGDVLSWSDPLLQLLQNIVEAGDPITYGPYLTRGPQPLAGKATSPRNALQFEAIYDELVTDEGNEALARVAGWGIATPNLGSNADLLDPKKATSNPRKTPIPDVSPDSSGAIHDTPGQGFTAVVVQCSPCQHGQDLVASHGEHQFKIPFTPPFTRLDNRLPFTEDFRGLQAMATSFIDDAFQGKVPRVVGVKAPVRDYDADGTPDDTDPDSNDPNVK